ncbi:MAG: polyphosphate polymerase domain-containing protein [Oscillospiraceae bacterium]|jgi:hypothetical protein|nr:polyphosphate polymerase domain-containing protein [Oscillospiraceae bacterium]
MNEVLRQEKKFLIPLDKYYDLSHRLGMILRTDSHSSGDGYLIRSLYYDTIDDNDFEEKDEGVELRRKIRLRCYGPDTPFAMLEMKQKQGAMQKKRSLRMEKEDARRMIQGDYTVLLNYKVPFAEECFGLMNMRCYRPKAIISYTRKVFVADENKIRITFDHHIKGTEASYDIFRKDLMETALLDPYLTVLEVKYNGFLLTYIKDIISECRSNEMAISKYCLGRTVSKHYLF